LRSQFLRLPRKTLWAQPVVGGFFVGVSGWFVPQILGVGYKHVGEALNGGIALKLMVILLALKLIAVAVSYASGNAGGIFGPSLFLGAMLGGIVGNIANYFLPGHVASPGAYALVGMGAAFAGIVRAPMTSVVMIFELTRDYAVIVPLMIANLASFLIASRFQEEPIYEVLAHQDGIHLPSAESRQPQWRHCVRNVMRASSELLSENLSVQDAMQKILHSRLNAWPVTNDHGIVGIVSREKLNQAYSDGLSSKILAELLDSREFPHLHADQTLHQALERMGESHLDVLPVVGRANIHDLEGIVTLSNVLALYGVAPLESEDKSPQ
jgi:CIC family chloride channel protein